MAEPDAVGNPPANGPPVPKGDRPLTLADVQREMERATEPLRAAQRAAEAFAAPIRAAAEAHEKMLAPLRGFERQQRELFVAIDSGIGQYLRAMVGQPAETARTTPPTTTTPVRTPPRPVPEKPGRVATVGAEKPAPSIAADEFRAAVMPMLEQLVADIRLEISSLKKRPRARGKTTCERLQGLFKRDPVFVIEATLEEIGAEIDRKPPTICESPYYNTKLKTLREKHVAAKALASRDAATLAVDPYEHGI
jgi:hypothetical protein